MIMMLKRKNVRTKDPQQDGNRQKPAENLDLYSPHLHSPTKIYTLLEEVIRLLIHVIGFIFQLLETFLILFDQQNCLISTDSNKNK